MKYNLKEMNSQDKPREKLTKKGTVSLTDAELLAILLRTGTKSISALDISHEIIESVNSLSDLQNITIEELMRIKGIGSAKATTILACIEFGKRVMNFKKDNYKIKSSKDAYNYIKDKIDYLPQENFYAIYLKTNNDVINDKLINIGTSREIVSDNKDIIRWAIKYLAVGIIIAHNHPSGDPLPSREDIDFTIKLKQACDLVNILLIDHIIVGKNKYYSFKDQSLITMRK